MEDAGKGSQELSNCQRDWAGAIRIMVKASLLKLIEILFPHKNFPSSWVDSLDISSDPFTTLSSKVFA
jgi:hypothetical protein